MRVLTVATDLGNAFLRGVLLPSCVKAGLELVILVPADPWRGFVTKRHTMAKYLSQGQDEQEIVVFTDAYDALFLRGERHILEEYRRDGHGVLFSGESSCWPLGVLGFALYGSRGEGRHPYLNSGGYVGRVADIWSLLRKYRDPPVSAFELLRQVESHGYDLHERFGWSDQYYWSLVHLLERATVGIDRHARIFECLGPPITDVIPREVDEQVMDFKANGRESSVYKESYARLSIALEQPSSAAQLHFAGLVTKAVVMDMLADKTMPAWIADVVSEEVPLDAATVVEVA